ncbi:cupin domain-containing protein [Candidatus Bathyarchaeota archaeon]|nr:cupin domain-containing protein [Candidatus Bathyarchaeota archaeon]
MKYRRIDEAPGFHPAEGVYLRLLADGKRMTLVRFDMEPGAVIPPHSHPHEQAGVCVKGGGVLTSGGRTIEVEAGMAWVIPGGEEHSFKAGEGGAIIYEAFSPPREDYLERALGQGGSSP